MKRIFVALSLVLIAVTGYAQGFSLLENSPVSSAMGYAGSASCADLSWGAAENPAKLFYGGSKGEVSAAYRRYNPHGITSNDFGAAFGIRVGKRVALSIHGIYQAQEKYSIINENGAFTAEEFTPGNLSVGIGLGIKFIDALSLGVSLRMLHSSIAPELSLNALSANALLMAHFGDFSIIGGVANVGGALRKGGPGLPSSGKIGGDYSHCFAGKHNIEIALDADFFFKGGIGMGVGAQYNWKEHIFVRGGYHYGSEKCLLPSFGTVGAGIKFWGVGLDFAYLIGNNLKDTFTVGLKFGF